MRERTVILTLKETPKRREAVKEEFDSAGIDFSFFEAVKLGFAGAVVDGVNCGGAGIFNETQPNEFSCFLNHYSIIKAAYLDGVELLCVFEDDILLINNFKERLREALNNAPDCFDMLLLYSFHQNSKLRRHNDFWLKASQCWSSCGNIMTRRFMKEYIDLADSSPMVADMVSFRLQDKLNCYLASEFLVVPRIDVESNIRENVNYLKSLDNINYDNYGKH